MQKLIEYFEKKFNKKIKKFNGIEWVKISKSQNPCLSEEFIREFRNNVDWYWISGVQILSEDFIREYRNRVHWVLIPHCQKLSGEFIEEFKDKAHLEWLSKHNWINYLKYRLKLGKISNEEYLKELINENKRIN